MSPTTHRIAFPAPRRAWSGADASHPWTREEALAAISAGCWFVKGLHDLEPAARKALWPTDSAS